MLFYLSLLLILLLLQIFFKINSRKRIRQILANIPEPYAGRFLSFVPLLITLNTENLLEISEERFHKYGNLLYANFYLRQLVFCADIEFTEQILSSSKHIVKHNSYQVLRQWLGNGLLLSDGSKWFSRRRIMTPAFHFKILEEFLEIMAQQSNILVERLAEKADGVRAFDIHSYVSLAALDIVAETAMGTKVHAQTNAGSEYTIAVKELTHLVGKRFIQLHLHNEYMFNILQPLRKLRQTKLLKTIHEFTRNVIEKRRCALQQSMSSETDAPISKTSTKQVAKKHQALLDVLLQAEINGKPLSNEDIREEVDTFMFEGHDTSTATMCFALYLISRHSQVQQKLLAELENVMEYAEAPPTMAKLNELKYLECVIKETLRLYPPVPIASRNIMEDFKYTHSKIGDGVIPAGTEILISLYSIMRNPEIYEQPNEFIPERFEDNTRFNGFSYVPFSAGPRNCIGQKFAMMEMKVVLSKIVCAYELLPFGETVRPELNVVLRSANGFQLGLKKRSIR